MHGWRVIAWGVVLALPVSLPVTVVALARGSAHPSPAAIAGFAYVGIFSMFLGFVVWYRGLAEAGIARASQLQLGQPMLTIAWSVPVLGEHAGVPELITAAAVAGCIFATQRVRTAPRREPAPAVIRSDADELW
ncbi:MAG: EamA family transporter, partial [Pseudonocardiaceae bacterium]